MSEEGFRPGRAIYKCWIPDRGQTIDDARQMEDVGTREAATYYARRYCGFDGDPFNDIVVRVRCERFERDGKWIESGFEWNVHVNVRAEPVFEAERVVQHGVVVRPPEEDWRNEQVD